MKYTRAFNLFVSALALFGCGCIDDGEVSASTTLSSLSEGEAQELCEMVQGGVIATGVRCQCQRQRLAVLSAFPTLSGGNSAEPQSTCQEFLSSCLDEGTPERRRGPTGAERHLLDARNGRVDGVCGNGRRLRELPGRYSANYRGGALRRHAKL